MSDRVSYMVGDTNHRDHSMWPTILESQIPSLGGPPSPAQYNFIWPVYISLAQIMALSWRVRKWRLAGSVTASKTFTGGSFSISGTAIIPDVDLFTLRSGAGITRESELLFEAFEFGFLGSAFRSLGNDGIGAEDVSPIVSNWSTTGNLNGDWSGSEEIAITIFTTWPLLFSAGTFAPPCFGLGTVIPHVDEENQLIVNADFLRDPVEVLSGPVILKTPITMTVDPGITSSFDVPMQLSWRFFSDVVGGSGSGSGAFTLEATEFWSYDGTYDTATGAQLLDPFR